MLNIDSLNASIKRRIIRLDQKTGLSYMLSYMGLQETHFKYKQAYGLIVGTSLVVQWLRQPAPTAGNMHLIPHQIPTY